MRTPHSGTISTIARPEPTWARLAVLTLAALATGCTSPPDADQIVTASIERHGGPTMKSSRVDFTFRDKRFSMSRKDGVFSYERTFTDSIGRIRDVVNNNEIFREVDGERVELDSTKQRSVHVGVNSVVYFASLPMPLNDPAARRRLLGTTTVRGVDYYEIEVTFSPENGGLDHEDRFVYWIRKDNYKVDYLAYYYHTDETGSRFRVAVNERNVGGILFADYLNYRETGDTLATRVELFDDLFEGDALELVSEIRLDSIVVHPL